MRAPVVRRKTHDAAITTAKVTIRERDRQLSRLGHQVLETKREHAKLLDGLRLLRTRIEYPAPNSDRIGFSFEMHGAVFDSYRRDATFVGLLAYMIEGAMHKTPEGRRALAGYFGGASTNQSDRPA